MLCSCQCELPIIQSVRDYMTCVSYLITEEIVNVTKKFVENQKGITIQELLNILLEKSFLVLNSISEMGNQSMKIVPYFYVHV